MVQRVDEQKLRGGYYTPLEITEFISKWAIDTTTKKILEPSCGDGNFVESVIKRLQDLEVKNRYISRKITAIELIAQEAYKTKSRVEDLGINSNCILHSDFFHYLSENIAKRYDVVVGNPPFIRYQNFPEKHRDLAIGMMKELGFKPNKLTNIWLPFLVLSSSILSNNGKLGMVIPAELFAVKYAEETRVYLSRFFERITLITFKKLVFSGIQQEVVLLLSEKKVKKDRGIRIVEFDNLEDMEKFDFNTLSNIPIKTIDHTSEKWTKYFLEEDEINLLRKIKQEKKIPLCDNIMDVDVGIVTGRNDFFMLNQEDVDKWKLHDYTQKVVSRSNQLKGIIFNKDDFEENSKNNLNTYLFIPPTVDFKELPKVCQKYIKYGEENNHHVGYKCRIRKRWYITPSLWNCEAFALRQVHLYPKLILNQVESSSTDTIHRIRFLSNHNPKYIMLSFLNSLTFAFSEITGRSYGGGVMTFEPTEIEKLPIPIVDELDIDFDEIDRLMREKEINKILDIIDRAILIEQYGFSKEETILFRNIWKKLSSRRINRKGKK